MNEQGLTHAARQFATLSAVGLPCKEADPVLWHHELGYSTHIMSGGEDGGGEGGGGGGDGGSDRAKRVKV